MPRPTSKKQLIEQSQTNWDKLQSQVNQLSANEIIEGGTVGEWSVKDVLAHLLEWQQMTLSWYYSGKRGEMPLTPSEKFTWREIPALNQAIFEKYQHAELDDIKTWLEASHLEAIESIEMMSDDELFTPKVYKWTKSTTLGSYLTSATCSHYDWAIKQIRRGIKAKLKA